MHLKTCSKCGEEKPLTEYYKNKDCKHGVRPDCKVCMKKQKDIYRSNPSNWKRELAAERVRKSTPEQKKKISEYNALPQVLAKRKACTERYRKTDSGMALDAARTTKRRAAKLQRTPSWANEQLIAAYYMEAKRLEELTGIQFQVDHIIPLQGEMVSGLHVETNLQLLPASENQGKSNRFDPETFVA